VEVVATPPDAAAKPEIPAMLASPPKVYRCEPGRAAACLDGVVEGLLVADPAASSTQLVLRVDDAPAHPVWTPADGGREVTFALPATTDATFRARAVPLVYGDRAKHGLTREAHLVRVEVNGGAGRGAGAGFVATRLMVLDGTPGYAIEPARAIRDLVDARAQETTKEGSALRTRLRNAVASHAARHPVPAASVREREEVTFTWSGTWRRTDERLAFVVKALATTRFVRVLPNPDPLAGRCGCVGPACATRYHAKQVREERVFVVVQTERFEIDKAGQRAREPEVEVEASGGDPALVELPDDDRSRCP
jgi:hypothetical protein